ncbi:MAG: hydantoinase/oxoprolinase family protein, partial [Eubacteriales bacterium]
EVFKGFSLYIWSSRGIFVTPAEVKKDPLQVAAANWLASAEALAQSVFLENKAAIFADMGSTTTDIIPLSKGKVLVQGRTDTERLVSGELVYTGLLRTSISSIVDYIYLDGVRCRVANEYFAISADVYRLLGLISEKDYDVPTPDGGKRDIEGCARRLARVIASDLEELGIEKIFVMARYLQDKQIQQIADSIWQIISRKKIAFPQYLISTGQGSFLLEEVAHRLLCPIIPWWEIIPGAQVEQVMSAYSVAWLLSERLSK